MQKIIIKIKKDTEYAYLVDMVRRGFGNNDLEIISTLSKEKAMIFNRYTKNDSMFLEDVKLYLRLYKLDFKEEIIDS